ncbi:hypothetical protein R1flu_016070 [Riccia fluitans]|uniref:Kinesin motor domain-containing protein n=1 Tax=Riccia fluitans TaxID=41844 RepID=A0ABD1YKS1_9MARC
MNDERRWRDSLDENLYEESVDVDDSASYLSFGTCTSASKHAPSVCFDYASRKKSKETLKIREHPTIGPYVDRLEWKDIYSWGDMEQVISEGARRRTLGPTPSNRFSNRGHTIFTMRLLLGVKLTFHFSSYLQEQGGMESNVRVINLVDLAGTEKPNVYKKISKERLDESRCINRSIAHLNDMILHLSKNSKFVSYRNSTLTKLLRDSLRGNYKTFLIAHVSPAEQDFPESVNTLRHATEASHIQWTVPTSYPEKQSGFMVNGTKIVKTQNESSKYLAGNGDYQDISGCRILPPSNSRFGESLSWPELELLD